MYVFIYIYVRMDVVCENRWGVYIYIYIYVSFVVFISIYTYMYATIVY